MEKLIGQFKMIETEDGYRIEINGDKEKMKGMFCGLRWRKAHRSRHHPFGYGRGFWGGMGPCSCGGEEEEEGPE